MNHYHPHDNCHMNHYQLVDNCHMNHLMTLMKVFQGPICHFILTSHPQSDILDEAEEARKYESA
ncbi:unnamed protein product, partial [Nesidiocoris tenuis]